MEIIPNWHPIFVHFTVALLTVSAGLFVMSVFIGNEKSKNQCLTVARWNLWLGMAITIFTVLTGWYAYNSVGHDEPSHLAMIDHRNWALVTVSFYLLVTVISVTQYRRRKMSSTILVMGIFIGTLLLVSTAWRGGELVYRYGLGVMSLPKVEPASAADDGYGHDHGSSIERKSEAILEKQIIQKMPSHNEDGHAH